MKKIFLLVMLLAAGLLPASALAGWVIQEQGALGDPRTTYIQDDKWMTISRSNVTIFDTGDKRIIFINPDRKRFWRGTPEEFRMESLGAQVDRNLEHLPPEERDRKRQEMLSVLEDMQSREQKHTYTVKRAGDSEKIAGYPTVEYEVFEDGRKAEAFWLAESVGIQKEFDFESMMKMWREMLPPNVEMPKYSTEVMKIMKKGLVLKTMEFNQLGMASDMWEAISVEEKKLPADAFAVPKGYAESELYSVIE